MKPYAIVVPWHREEELESFRRAWKIGTTPEWLILQQDTMREGCGVTKNKGLAQAINSGADVVIVLDGDCYPCGQTCLEQLAEQHLKCLEPQAVTMFEAVTDPPSRGTPFDTVTVTMPVAASMGFWVQVPDYDAVRQLAHQCAPMDYYRRTIHGKYFALCGMNLAFRPSLWLPWCQFIDVPRFDDIWMGWLWQKEAYRRGYCFNLNGPMITHARQSNVWINLHLEAQHLETNETLWQAIALSGSYEYESLRKLLPI